MLRSLAFRGRARKSNSRRFAANIFSVLIALVSICSIIERPAWAQVLFGSMVGTVTDATGASVPDATVKITNTMTNESRTVQTNADGAYTISTVPSGIYAVSVEKTGFSGFLASRVEVRENNTIRVDAQMQIGAQTQRVEVTAESAVLQTDRADVHSEIGAKSLETLPQPNRSYQGLLNLVPGINPPGGQLQGGTNNPSKSMQFSANGSGTAGSNVRIEGVSANNPWVVQYTTFVPSVEAIENVNVVTNSPDAEQGQAAGASVNVQLKSGTNETHGAAFLYNIDSFFTARNFFSPAGQKVAHLVDNNTGGSVGGHIIKDKLFYFGSYEGDYLRQANSAVISVPTPSMLNGNMQNSNIPIYDPRSGNTLTGTGRTPFPNNVIPTNRFDPVIQKMIPLIPAPNLPGDINNYFVNQATTYNLHKIDTKVDYTATSKLRISGRYGYQPYNAYQAPLFGPILGGSSSGWPSLSASAGAGNTSQHGATLAISSSATYVASPTFIIDATFGVTQAHQLLFPVLSDQKYAANVLGIPGTNVGSLPWAGGIPSFSIANYGGSANGESATFGYSYPPLEYKDPIFEYVVNATKIVGSHNIRFGVDITRLHQNHIEVRPSYFNFQGGITALNGGAAPNSYNAISDFLLGAPTTMQSSIQYAQPYLTIRSWRDSLYVRDQWQVSRKLTVNYGVRWEYYPFPQQESRGINQYDFATNTVQECGTGGLPSDCGVHISKKLFAPSIGIAYRPTEKTVIRMGYALSPFQLDMGRSGLQSYPDVINSVYNGPNTYVAPGSVSTGIPLVPPPTPVNGRVAAPAGAGNLFANQTDFQRGYIQSWNFTIQRELGRGWTGQAGYVGSHNVHMNTTYNVNYGQVGGGAASQLLYSKGITGTVNVNLPAAYSHYNSLQTSLQRRFTNGLSTQLSYTWSHEIGLCCGGETGQPSILIPQYQRLNFATMPMDVTHNLHIAAIYELPFGKDKPFLQHGIGAILAGGWSTNALFSHTSGLPFSVTASAASLNAPGNTQRADQVKANVNLVGTGVGGQAYFDPLAFAAVTTARFGTAGFNTLRGPGNTNLDLGLFRSFPITERIRLQIRGEALNLSNTPHFGNPGNNVSNLQLNGDGSIRNLNGFSQITSTNPLGRLIDPRYFRFGLRFIF